MANNIVGATEIQSEFVSAEFISRIILTNPLIGLNGRQLNANVASAQFPVQGALGETKTVSYVEQTSGTPAFPEVQTRQPENSMRSFNSHTITFREALISLVPIRRLYNYDKIAQDILNMIETLARGTTLQAVDSIKPTANEDLTTDRVVYTSGATETFNVNGATGTRRLITYADFRALADRFDQQSIPQSTDNPAESRIVLMPRFMYNRLTAIDEITRYDYNGIGGLYNNLSYSRIHNFFVFPMDFDLAYRQTAATTIQPLASQQNTTLTSTDNPSQYSLACLCYHAPSLGYDISTPQYMETNEPTLLSTVMNGFVNYMVGNLFINPSTFLLVHNNA